jgi:hypothetical protein
MPESEPTAELHEAFSTKSEMFWAGTNRLRSGLDVVVEGAAARVTGQAQLQRLAAQLFGNGEPYSQTRYRLTA